MMQIPLEKEAVKMTALRNLMRIFSLKYCLENLCLKKHFRIFKVKSILRLFSQTIFRRLT